MGSGVLPGRTVNRILIDKDNHNVAYVAFGGYDSDNLYKTTDNGQTWINITGDLPSVPILSVVRHPENAVWLYAGTEVGLFTSEDGGNTWSTTNDGPANVEIDELSWLDDTTLLAATYGRGMFSAIVSTELVTTATIISGILGNNGWYVSNVGISLSASDGGNGVKEIHTQLDKGAVTVTAGSTASVSITTGGYHAVIYYAVDNAGNKESPHTLNVNIDKTLPTIKIFGIVNDAKYGLGKVPVARYTVKDKPSGVASQSAILTGGNANLVGKFTYAVTATDKAGNTATKSVAYSVRYVFGGLSPRNGTKFKAGSIIPVKFRLKDAKGNYISAANATLMLQSPSGDPVTPTSGVNGSNVFQYDSTSNQYAYTLNTEGLATGEWQLLVTLDDGSPAKTTHIKLK